MSYLELDQISKSTDVIDDILYRKEFNWLKQWEHKKQDQDNIIPRFLLDAAIENSMNLRLSSYQMFVQNFLNPNTPYKRLLLKWSTGSGKTIGALSIAMNFIECYKKERELESQEIGTIFVIGFSERAFKNELLAHPEFGFLSLTEKAKLEKLKRLAAVGSRKDVETYQELVTKIKKRFTNRKGNGFFKFYGYKAFVNRIFESNKLIDLTTLSENEINKALRDGTLKYNMELLAQFKNSIIICDEIHNVYNSLEKNNWGIAIQAVLDKEPSCRALFMSATPFSNSPTEIVDLLNLLVPVEMHVKKSDFFTTYKKKIVAQTGENDVIEMLKPHALDKIAELCRGRISYLQDVNPKYYPSVSMAGEPIPGIPYLKFIRCKMSPFQYNTYKQIYHDALSQESQYIMDFVLENPDPKSNLGIYQTNQIKTLLANASTKWKAKYGLDYINHKIVGDALERQNIAKYSTKYATMLDHIQDIIKNKKGKLFIYHNVVHMSGVLFIEQLLIRNGYLDEYSASNDNTICVICGKRKIEHSKEELIGAYEKWYKNPTTDTVLAASTLPADDVALDDNTPHGTNDDGNASSNASSNDNSNEIISDGHDSNHDYSLDGYTLQEDDNSELEEKDELNDENGINVNNILFDDVNSIENSTAESIKGGDIKPAEALARYEKSLNHDHDDCITVRRNKNNITWFRDETEMLTAKYLKSAIDKFDPFDNFAHYYIEFASCDDKLRTHDAHALKDLTHFFNTLKGIPIIFQVHLSCPRLSEWLIQAGFKPAKFTNKHVYMAWPKTKITKSMKNSSKVIGGNTKKTKRTLHLSKVDHIFMPVRFIIAHSDIDKTTIEHSFEKYNSVDNTEGHRFLILVGSRIIKESYNTKAICNLFVMSKPDNIPMFIQIRGRAVRKDSHKYLPADKRHVTVSVFTSCLPVKDEKGHYKLSYEELKYKEKILSFQIMQQIELVMHENAIDNFINYSPKEQIDPLGPLPYKPKYDPKLNKEFTLNELSIGTFDVYYQKREVDLCKMIIKRLFIDQSSVWEHGDLVEAIHNNRYDIDINKELFSESSIMIAIGQLIWVDDADLVEPITDKSQLITDTHTINKQYENYGPVIDRLMDPNDKLVTFPTGQDNIIVPFNNHKDDKQYYILFPINKSAIPDIDLDLPFRTNKVTVSQSINITHFMQTKRIDFDYDDKKKIFYNKYADISIENMQNVVCEYGTLFHVKFAEECISYIFRVWTDPTVLKSPMHEFYFKMLYYYDLLSLIIFGYTCKPKVFKQYYAKYATPVHAKDIKLKTMRRYEEREALQRKDVIDEYTPIDNSDLATSGIINLLRTSLNRTSNTWIPQEFREDFNNTVEKSLSLFAGRYKRSKHLQKVSALYLPVGHYLSKYPRIYIPDKQVFVEDPSYSQSDETFIENDFIIGFDERSETGVHIRFKLREPAHKMKKAKDKRTAARGVVCKSKSKTQLREIAKKLDILLDDESPNVDDFCDLIRSKLIRLELKERIKKSKLKYFYFHYE